MTRAEFPNNRLAQDGNVERFARLDHETARIASIRIVTDVKELLCGNG
jgi:hypothetical protein